MDTFGYLGQGFGVALSPYNLVTALCGTLIGTVVGLLLVFAGTFEPLGFILSSMLIGIPMARLYGGRWVPSVVIVSLMAIGLYLLFDKLMDVPLPLGVLDVLEN